MFQHVERDANGETLGGELGVGKCANVKQNTNSRKILVMEGTVCLSCEYYLQSKKN